MFDTSVLHPRPPSYWENKRAEMASTAAATTAPVTDPAPATAPAPEGIKCLLHGISVE